LFDYYRILLIQTEPANYSIIAVLQDSQNRQLCVSYINDGATPVTENTISCGNYSNPGVLPVKINAMYICYSHIILGGSFQTIEPFGDFNNIAMIAKSNNYKEVRQKIQPSLMGANGLTNDNSSVEITNIVGGPVELSDYYIFVTGNFNLKPISMSNLGYFDLGQKKWFACSKFVGSGITSLLSVKGKPTTPPPNFLDQNLLLFIVIGVLTLLMIVVGACCISSLPEKDDANAFESY